MAKHLEVVFYNYYDSWGICVSVDSKRVQSEAILQVKRMLTLAAGGANQFGSTFTNPRISFNLVLVGAVR